MVPGGRLLIDIGYKYNARKVLYFIFTYNTGIKQAVIIYLSKYTDQFTNAAILLFARPLVMSNLYLQLTILNPTINQGSLIWIWRSYGLLSVVGFSYIPQLLW